MTPLPELVTVHPLLQGAPQHQRKEADQDVGLGAFGSLVVDGTQAQVVLADAKAVFDLGQSDVGLPERGRILAL